MDLQALRCGLRARCGVRVAEDLAGERQDPGCGLRLGGVFGRDPLGRGHDGWGTGPAISIFEGSAIIHNGTWWTNTKRHLDSDTEGDTKFPKHFSDLMGRRQMAMDCGKGCGKTGSGDSVLGQFLRDFLWWEGKRQNHTLAHQGHLESPKLWVQGSPPPQTMFTAGAARTQAPASKISCCLLLRASEQGGRSTAVIPKERDLRLWRW